MSGRREFLCHAAIAGVASALGIGRHAWAAESQPETPRLRLGRLGSLCVAPQYLAHELLLAEGFTDIQYFGDQASSAGLRGARAMGAGEFDISMNFAAPLVLALDENLPIVILGGVHAGCFELFVTDKVRSIGDLKGKRVAVQALGSIQHIFLASIATSVGIHPVRDIHWAIHSNLESKKLLAQGGIDAFLAFPPDPQELRANRIGRVLLNGSVDRPWSQYFCCLVAANREFAHKHPVATRRALRAILKAGEICASDPTRAVGAYTKLGYPINPEYARQAIGELPYGKWRDYNPEETVRFYALRLREAEMVKSTPQKLIAQGTDWRFLEQLKKELKA